MGDPERAQLALSKNNWLALLSSPDFVAGPGKVIIDHFNNLISREIEIARSYPQLLTVARSAHASLDVLPPDDLELVAPACDRFLSEMHDEKRLMKIDFNHRKNSRTHLSFYTVPFAFPGGFWEAAEIQIQKGNGALFPGFHIFSKFRDNAAIAMNAPHKQFSDEERLSLMLDILNSVKAGVNETDIEKTVSDLSMRFSIAEVNLLRDLVGHPETIKHLLPADKMYIIPQRLMTNEEYNLWIKRVRTVSGKPKIRKSSGSVDKFSSYPGNTEGSYILSEEWFDGNGNPQEVEIISVPIEIKEGGETIGWQIADIQRFPQKPLRTIFHHGARNILDIQ